MSTTTRTERVAEIKDKLRPARQNVRERERQKAGIGARLNRRAALSRSNGPGHEAELRAGAEGVHTDRLLQNARTEVERLEQELAQAEAELNAATARRRLVEARLAERQEQYAQARAAIAQAVKGADIDALEHDAALLFSKCQVLSAIVQDLQ